MFFLKDENQKTDEEVFREQKRRAQLKEDMDTLADERRKKQQAEDADRSIGGFGDY
jgi:hypothetical protein